MTTRRERMERRIERREEWADGRRRKAAGLEKQNEPFRGDWAFATQPGRIPERERANRRDAKAHEHRSVAEHHDSKAAGLRSQLKRTIFSDDPDAVEQLGAKIERLDAQRKRMKRVNAAHRAYLKNPAVLDSAKWADLTDEERTRIKTYEPAYSWEPHPFPPYALKNIGGRIKQARERIKQIQVRAERTERAKQAGGVLVEGDEWVSVTFDEKPPRETLAALKAAGFYWNGGSWHGKRASLPEEIEA